MQNMMKAQQAAGGVPPGMEHIMAQMHGVDAGGAGGWQQQPAQEQPPPGSQRGRGMQQPAGQPMYQMYQDERLAWPEPEPGSIWEVVGGEETGGIIVRAGRELTSPQEKRRLTTSALIREEELIGDRLSYTRVAGSGPMMGWVSIASRGKPLVMKVEGAG
eukprot:CAMPEP_0168476438 /NCGR_PEP_ID=MMETSP0228-20121227/61890_1 /TAXON_ID=133427 /ORGANISM="Protoceratium reticulatum, Strain CCCM 535 (=CCMP 1889)" /LENGTH=159 /DNA_ID=CAMNT_0008492563 /DNA_START=1 /DNA_END=476 /DNA_ORIENTATION=+